MKGPLRYFPWFVFILFIPFFYRLLSFVVCFLIFFFENKPMTKDIEQAVKEGK